MDFLRDQYHFLFITLMRWNMVPSNLALVGRDGSAGKMSFRGISWINPYSESTDHCNSLLWCWGTQHIFYFSTSLMQNLGKSMRILYNTLEIIFMFKNSSFSLWAGGRLSHVWWAGIFSTLLQGDIRSPMFPSSKLGHCLLAFLWSAWPRLCTSKVLWDFGFGPSAGDVRDAHSIPGSRRYPGEGYDNPLQCSCLENPMDRGAWQAIVHGVAQSQT